MRSVASANPQVAAAGFRTHAVCDSNAAERCKQQLLDSLLAAPRNILPAPVLVGLAVRAALAEGIFCRENLVDNP
jgi:hypothetical protein